MKLFLISDATQSSSGLSNCPKLTEVPSSMQVPFGYDVSTGCMLSLNRAQLESLCCEGSTACASNSDSPYSDSTGLPYLFVPDRQDTSYLTNGYIGIYGNADPLDKSQWVPITVKTPLSSRRWNAASGTCSSMFTSMEIKFLVAKVGEKNNPQNKIVSASIFYTNSDWTINTPVANTVTPQTFSLSLTVSYIYAKQSDLVGYVPPPPPVLFKVPYDVFYPFVLSSSASPSIHKNSFFLIIPVLFSCILLASSYKN